MRKLFSLCLMLALLSPVCVSAKEYEWAEGGDQPTMKDLITNKEQVTSYLEELKRINDSRQVFNSASPEFLETYGKLFVAGQQACTGNIVSNKPTNDSYIVTSSAHCFKTDNPQEISIVFWGRNGDEIKRQLTLEIINREYDYAILRLDRKIENSLIKPLVISPYVFRDLMDEADLLFLDPVITVAGYSSDEDLGQNGKVLTYDQNCSERFYFDGFKAMTDGTSYPGASGGATVVSLDDTDFHFDYFVGVHKAGTLDPMDIISDTDKENDLTVKVQRAIFVDLAVMYDDLFNALGSPKDDDYDFFEVMGL